MMTSMTDEIYQTFLRSGTLLSKDKHHLLIGWGRRKWSSKRPDVEAPSFYFPDFFLKIGMPWFIHEQWMEISLEEFKTFLPKKVPQEEINWHFNADFFEAKFAELEKSIDSKQLVKAVPYLFESTTTTMSIQRLEMSLSHLMDYIGLYPAHVYGLWGEREGFLGATPEILFDQTHGLLETMACAGTFPQNDCLIDEKLLLEHAVVVEGIRSSLEPFGPVTIGEKQSANFGKLVHLVTPIQLQLKSNGEFEKLVRALHPTPALGAFPKEPGMLWLEQYQMEIPRDRYGAPAGFYSNHHSKCLVGIRNVQWNGRGMKIGAGCGVVKGSTLKLELDEIKLKLEAIKEMLYI